MSWRMGVGVGNERLCLRKTLRVDGSGDGEGADGWRGSIAII